MFQRSFDKRRPELVPLSGGLNKYLTAQLQPVPQQQCMLVYPAYRRCFVLLFLNIVIYTKRLF